MKIIVSCAKIIVSTRYKNECLTLVESFFNTVNLLFDVADNAAVHADCWRDEQHEQDGR
jgi:hypothetical protein